MKTIKTYTSVLFFICISIIAGCSDSIVSNENTGSPTLRAYNSDSPANLEEAVYNGKFSLNPGETIHLNYENTNLILIHSYSVSNCSMASRDLLIRSSMQADSTSLPCSWKKHGSFAFEDLSVKNISPLKKTVSVNLWGLTLNN